MNCGKKSIICPQTEMHRLTFVARDHTMTLLHPIAHLTLREDTMATDLNSRFQQAADDSEIAETSRQQHPAQTVFALQASHRRRCQRQPPRRLRHGRQDEVRRLGQLKGKTKEAAMQEIHRSGREFESEKVSAL